MRNFFKKNPIQKALGLLALVLAVGGVFILHSSLPDTYYYYEAENAYSSSGPTIHFVTIFEETVLQTEFYPDCEREVREVEPSTGFGAAWALCDKRKIFFWTIDSIDETALEKSYVLKTPRPTEKGDDFQRTLVQTEDGVEFKEKTYSKSSLLSLLWRFIQ